MSTIEHPEPSSSLSDHSTIVDPDPEAPTDANPPDGPHIQEVRGMPGAATTKSSKSSSSSDS
jgi:hypothetical protein